MHRLKLTLAMGRYLHTDALAMGAVQPQGIDLRVLVMPFEQAAQRFARSFEWEVSEFSLATYARAVSETDKPPMVALPVFPSRVFRQSAFYVRSDSAAQSPQDLIGGKIGIPQWVQTATVFARGYLAHDAGVSLEAVSWVQAGVNEPGRRDPPGLRLPEGISLSSRPDSTLDQLLSHGEIDAVISARAPNGFRPNGPIRRLFRDSREEEENYFRRTGIFPIMHLIVVRRDAYEKNRWILRSLLEAFEQAKSIALTQLYDGTSSALPTAWGSSFAEETNAVLFPDGNHWPYGVEPNRRTLDTFLQYCDEQGVTGRRLQVDDLFCDELTFAVRV